MNWDAVEAAHFANGQLPLKELMNFPGLRAWWRHNCDSFSIEFRVHVNGFAPND